MHVAHRLLALLQWHIHLLELSRVRQHANLCMQTSRCMFAEHCMHDCIELMCT